MIGHDDTAPGAPSLPSRALEFGLQPAILVIVLALWMLYRDRPEIYPLVVVGVQLVLGTLEHWMPARRDWVQPAREKSTNIAIVLVVSTGALLVAGLYVSMLAAPLGELRRQLHLDVWPTTWPLLIQVLLAFFLSEFIWYWMHRSEHRFRWIWRLSGHGAHHSFKRLGAINFGANHPLEMFLLVLPATLVELLFGAGIAAAGAVMLVAVQASIAHANLRLNSNGIGWLFTTNAYHIRHHSAVLEESNTNYGCAAIVWDRLFGTLSQGPVVEAGIGPTEPNLWQKLLLPLREPADIEVAP